MPIFTYFAVAGTMLLGLLFAADAVLPPGPGFSYSSNFDGLPPKWRAPPEPPTLIAAPAPEPDMKSPQVLAAAPDVPAKVLAAPVVAAKSAKPHKRRIAAAAPKPQLPHDWREARGQAFGGQAFGGQAFGDRAFGNWFSRDGDRRWASRGPTMGPWLR